VRGKEGEDERRGEEKGGMYKRKREERM